eukprot:gene9983-2302_t
MMDSLSKGIYISEEGRKNVLTYKYTPCDDSLLSPYLEPFWNWFLETLVPTWMAPNVVTLIGFLAIILHYFLCVFYMPMLEGPAPRWIFFVNGLGIFWYQTLDAVDGKQARRTKNGSPLGELFDHGCDSLTSMFQTIGVACCLQLGGSIWTFLLFTSIQTIFYFSIWEQYYTGVLRFSKVGPTEGILLVVGIHFSCGIFGVELYKINMRDFLTFLPFDFTIGHIVALSFFAPLIPSMIQGIYEVAKAKLTNEQKLLKGSAIRAAFPYIFVYTCWFIWIFCGPRDIVNLYPLLIYTIFGLVTGYIVTRLVISRVCGETCQSWYIMTLPLPLLAFNTLNKRFLFIPFLEVPDFISIVLYLIFVIICYSHMILFCIHILSTALGIRAFVLKPVK